MQDQCIIILQLTVVHVASTCPAASSVWLYTPTNGDVMSSTERLLQTRQLSMQWARRVSVNEVGGLE